MSITSAEVQHVAKLAKLSFNAEELEKMARELDAIVAYVEQLKELELDEVPPTAHVLDLSNILREDQAEAALPVEDVLRNAPSRKLSYFSVPKVIG